MSYCRFSDGDVYVYLDYCGYLCCCACALDGGTNFHSTAEMVRHLGEHIAAGHIVPDDVIPALEADREENDRYIAEAAASTEQEAPDA